MSMRSAWLLFRLKGNLRWGEIWGSKEEKRKAGAIPELVGVDGCCVLMAVAAALLKEEQAWRAIPREQPLLVTEVLKSSLPLKTEPCGL